MIQTENQYENLELNYTFDQMDLTDIYIQNFVLTAIKYTFFSNTHEIFSRPDLMLGHIESLQI
jgi:hypothetical protein